MRKTLYLIGVVLLVLMSTTSYAVAQGNSMWPFRQNERVVVEQNETIDKDLFATGERVEIKGNVNGDLYAAGGNIVVDGIVNGDVLAAGGEITINGKVLGNARVAGGEIRVKGSIGKNMTAGAGNVTIDNEASISGSLVFGAGNVEIDGPVGGNIVGGVGNLVVNNTVGGTIYAGVGNLSINDKARVAGDVVYWSDQKATVENGATVGGQLDYRQPVKPDQRGRENAVKSLWGGFKLFSLLSMIALGLLVLRFLPGVFEGGATLIDQKPWQSLGFGFLKLVLTPIIAVFLFISVIGIPLGIFLIFAYIAELYFSSYFVVYWTGKLIMGKFNQKANRYWIFVVGAVAYIIVASIPLLGGIVKFIGLLFGLGVLLLLKYSWYKKFFGKEKKV